MKKEKSHIMDIDIKQTYSEVYEVLGILGKNYINKLPSSLYKKIIKEKSDQYRPEYISITTIENQNIKKEAIAMIALLHLKYWCNSNEEKIKLKKLFQNNEKKYQNELRKKYNPDDLFKINIKMKQKQEENRKELENIKNQTIVVVENKNSVVEKIIKKIKLFLQFYKR